MPCQNIDCATLCGSSWQAVVMGYLLHWERCPIIYLFYSPELCYRSNRLSLNLVHRLSWIKIYNQVCTLSVTCRNVIGDIYHLCLIKFFLINDYYIWQSHHFQSSKICLFFFQYSNIYFAIFSWFIRIMYQFSNMHCTTPRWSTILRLLLVINVKV